MAPHPKTPSKPATTKTTPNEHTTCVICMNTPPSSEGPHHCTTCAPDAWVICAKCEESIKSKKCPICRSDYMREPTSEWETLPPSTTKLTLDAQPTQDELKRLALRFPRLECLELLCDYEDYPEELDFDDDGSVCFPSLTSLSLTCVGLRSIKFTEANTPALEQLSLSNISGNVCPFHLALPRLTYFFAEHTMLGERPVDAGQFGLSLSRCPRLETVDTYKFRCLGDVNYAVLPSLVSLNLHRSECSTHLDILYAPKLTDVSLQAAYELRGFKLRNIPTASLATVEALVTDRAEVWQRVHFEARAEDARWRDKTNVAALTEEARQRGWIDDDEEWDINVESTAVMDVDDDGNDVFIGQWRGDFNAYEEILENHCQDFFQERIEMALEGWEAQHISASVADDSLPRCLIDVTNMGGFRLENIEPQVRGRCQIQKSSDSGAFGSGWGFGGGGGLDVEGSEEEADNSNDDDDDDDESMLSEDSGSKE